MLTFHMHTVCQQAAAAAAVAEAAVAAQPVAS